MNLSKKFSFFALFSVLFVFSKMIGFAAGGGKKYEPQTPKDAYLQLPGQDDEMLLEGIMGDDQDEGSFGSSTVQSARDVDLEHEAIHQEFLEKFEDCLLVIKNPGLIKAKHDEVDTFIVAMEDNLHELSPRDLFKYMNRLSAERREYSIVDALGRKRIIAVPSENKKAYKKLFDYLVSVKERNNL